MTQWAYFFEARSIQPYILDGGRLSEMTKASERVDAICGELLDRVAGQLGLMNCDFMRRAAGSFVYLGKDRQQIERFRDAWSLLLPKFVPGLEWVHCVSAGADVKTATQEGFKLLAQARNVPVAILPESGPLAERSPRTGFAAVTRLKKRGKPELVDACTAGKNAGWKTGNNSNDGHTSLGSKFMPEGKRFFDGHLHLFPRNLEPDPEDISLEAFPFVGGARDIAILHVDGNGMGIVLRQIRESIQGHDDANYIKAYRAFSEAIGAATQAAVRQATREVLLPAAVTRKRDGNKSVRVLPARPLVLGGDDLSIMVRADLALPFARAFIAAFERETAVNLRALNEPALANSPGLTACAGLIYIKSSQPFAQAYKLAESLCQHAKESAANYSKEGVIKPSGIAFYRVSGSYFEDFEDDILKRIESVRDGDCQYRLTYGAYGIDANSGWPEIAALLGLCQFLDQPEIARGSARDLLLTLHQAPSLARKQYQRWRELMSKGHNNHLKIFDDYLKQLGVTNPSDTYFKKLDQCTYATALGDAVSLMAVDGHHISMQGAHI